LKQKLIYISNAEVMLPMAAAEKKNITNLRLLVI
jgi:hypothetical protein